MLSRRNIRIKIMQLLFALNRDQTLKPAEIVKSYQEYIDLSFQLYLFHIFLLLDVCRYARLDQEKRRGKYLPTPEDLLFSSKLYDNPHIQSLANNEQLQSRIKIYGFADSWDTDISRKVYFEFSKTEEYNEFVFDEDSNAERFIQILLSLYKFIIKHELCEELIDDRFSNWQDDKSLIIGAMKKTIKALPHETSLFFEEYRPETETVEEFGLTLLKEVVDREEELVSYIEPLLKNWDIDRVAVIDMILLKMAAAEILKFENIPGHISINEYVEISKQYSTEKSKEFVNGVVDKLFDVFVERGLKKEK